VASPPQAQGEPGTPESGGPSTFSAFRSKPFSLLWANTIVFALSQSIQQFTLVWLGLEIGKDGVELWSGLTVGSGTAVGLIVFALGAPVLVFGLYAGILTDRIDRRLLLFGSQVAGIVITAGAAALMATGSLTFWGVFGLAAMMGLIVAFGMPVRLAIVPSLVRPERVLNAVTLMNVGQQVALGGAAVSGGIIAVGGIEAAFAGQAILLSLGLFALFPLRVPMVHTGVRRSVREDLREGFTFVVQHPGIRSLMIVLLATALVMAGAFQALLPKIAVDHLGAGPFEASALLTVMLGGNLITSLVLASFRRVDRAGLFFLVTLVIGGILNVSIGLTPWYVLALAIMFINGMDAGIFVNLNMALIQAHTPNAIMGRVMSIYQMAMAGGMPLGALIAGLMADSVGTREWFAICGAMLILLGLGMIATQPALRRMSSAPDPTPEAAAAPAGG